MDIAALSSTLRRSLPDVLLRTAMLAAAWWALAGGAFDSWAIGIPAVIAAVALSLRLTPPAPSRLSLLGVVGFVLFFLFHSLRGGFLVARMALRPTLDLQPAEFEFPLRLQPGAGQLFLASSLCLMPGTLTVGLESGRLRMHVLDKRLPIERELRELEQRVARMFGEDLQ